MKLTRVSHKVSTAESQRTMSTALRSLNLLDVLFKYACRVFGPAPCIHGPLHLLATKPSEKRGFKDFNNLRNSEGKGFIGCLGAIVVLAVIIFVGIKLGPIYYSNYLFEEDLKTLVSRSGARYTPNDKIIIDIIDLAQKNHINLTHENAKNNVKIERFAGQLHITVRYFVPIDYLIIQRNKKFEIKLSSFTSS